MKHLNASKYHPNQHEMRTQIADLQAKLAAAEQRIRNQADRLLQNTDEEMQKRIGVLEIEVEKWKYECHGLLNQNALLDGKLENAEQRAEQAERHLVSEREAHRQHAKWGNQWHTKYEKAERDFLDKIKLALDQRDEARTALEAAQDAHTRIGGGNEG